MAEDGAACILAEDGAIVSADYGPEDKGSGSSDEDERRPAAKVRPSTMAYDHVCLCFAHQDA